MSEVSSDATLPTLSWLVVDYGEKTNKPQNPRLHLWHCTHLDQNQKMRPPRGNEINLQRCDECRRGLEMTIRLLNNLLNYKPNGR